MKFIYNRLVTTVFLYLVSVSVRGEGEGESYRDLGHRVTQHKDHSCSHGDANHITHQLTLSNIRNRIHQLNTDSKNHSLAFANSTVDYRALAFSLLKAHIQPDSNGYPLTFIIDDIDAEQHNIVLVSCSSGCLASVKRYEAEHPEAGPQTYCAVTSESCELTISEYKLHQRSSKDSEDVL